MLNFVDLHRFLELKFVEFLEILYLFLLKRKNLLKALFYL